MQSTGHALPLAFPLIEFPNAWSQGIADGIHKGLALNDAYRHSAFVEVAFAHIGLRRGHAQP